jgi:GNAT superfamily N-acetyltransferase
MQIDYEIKSLNDGASAERILRALPDWFGIETAILKYCADVITLPTYFAVNAGGDRLGFVSMKFHNEFTADIHVLGVLKEFHRFGIGKALIEHSADAARQRGCEYLMVKTVGPSCPDSYYAATRNFYLRVGFRPLEEFDSIWPGTPCLIMVKNL